MVVLTNILFHIPSFFIGFHDIKPFLILGLFALTLSNCTCFNPVLHKRQMEGIKAAKNNNVKFGRPPISKPQNWDSTVLKYKQNHLSKASNRRTRAKKDVIL